MLNPAYRRASGSQRRVQRPGVVAVAAILALSATSGLHGQSPRVSPPIRSSLTTAAPVSAVAAAGGVSTDYVIGPTDVLGIVFWQERELTSDVVVRPDGKITLPLLNDVMAAGLTPEQLRQRLAESSRRFIEDPVVTVVVRQVNNNRAFITGRVSHPGPYVLSGPTTVLQLISMAGGFTDFADRKHILITRLENGIQRAFSFNYDNVLKRREFRENLILKTGDTVVVP